MDTPQCYVGLGLLLGILIMSLVLAGETKRLRAMSKILGFDAQRKRADEIVREARQRRSEGYGELPLAYFLIVVAVFVLIVACLWLGGR